MSDPAKLHNLSIRLAEARREVIRSRTVARIIRSAYRLSDLGSSTETIPARFLMLVVENMICDCAAIFKVKDLRKKEYSVIESVGCLESYNENVIKIDIQDQFLVYNRNIDDNLKTDVVRFMNAEKVLCVSDTSTGYAIAIGFYYNSTIDYDFDLSDQDTMKDALSVYIDVLDRRRTRRLLEQARQGAEAREAEVNDVVSLTTERMLSIVDLIEESILGTNQNVADRSLKIEDVNLVSNLLVELRDIVSIASELTAKQVAPVVLEKEWVKLSDFLVFVVRNAQQACAKKDVDLQFRPPEVNVYIWLDRIWMEMILNTLLMEALAWVTKNGELLVEISRREDESIGVSIRGHSRSPVSSHDMSERDSELLNENQIPLSILRLIDAHHSNLVFERPNLSSVTICLYIKESECEER